MNLKAEVITIKTLIEIFDMCQVENAIAGLKFNPERIVYVGFKNVMSNKKTTALKDFLENKGVTSEIIFEKIEDYEYSLVVEKLNSIIETYPDCYIDLTGGKDIVLTAAGAVSNARNVPMFQFNVRSEKFINVFGCEDVLNTKTSFMTINEAMELNGCLVLDNEKEDVKWDFNDDFKKDISKMWDILKVHCGSWNKQANTFELLEKKGKVENGITSDEEIYIDQRIIESLKKAGLIYDYEKREKYITFKYKNSQIRKCLTKAGNILELYCYLILREIKEENSGYYDDVDQSIYIDWDGIVHSDKDPKYKDTKNEVDIMVTRDLIPIFISCKNGEVHKEALYELDTISKKFGGKYGKKYLLATYLSSDKESVKYLKQRAKDMNITLIDNLNTKTRKEIKDKFIKSIK